MELNVTKDTLPFCRALLKSAVGFCKTLNAEIELVKKQGATTPEGVKGGKKAAKKVAKKAAKTEEKAAKTEEKAAKKAAKTEEKAAKTEEKAAAKKTGKKVASKKDAKKDAKKASKKVVTEDGKRVTLKERVQAYLAANKTTDDLWTPKDLMSSTELEGTGNVPLNQVLNQLIKAEEIKRVYRGHYQML